MKNKLDVFAAAIVVVGLAFQFFFRYDYMKQGPYIVRIDRLNGDSCYLPCGLAMPTAPVSRPSAVATLNFADFQAEYDKQFDLRNQRAIALAKTQSDAVQFALYYPNYTWTSGTKKDSIPDPTLTGLPSRAQNVDYWLPTTFLICLCSGDSQGHGYRWEVHTDTREVFSVQDNATLAKKYDIDISAKK